MMTYMVKLRGDFLRLLVCERQEISQAEVCERDRKSVISVN